MKLEIASTATKKTKETNPFIDKINGALERMNLKKTEQQKTRESLSKKLSDFLDTIPDEILSEICVEPIAYRMEQTRRVIYRDSRGNDAVREETDTISEVGNIKIFASSTESVGGNGLG